MQVTFSFGQQGATNKSSSAVLLSVTYPADRTQMSNTRPNVPFGTGGEYIFNFCNFGRLQFQAGRFPNTLPNAKLWPVVRNTM
jgi:hypothetical protein